METAKNSYTARIEVRYAETDQMGVVHHAVYPVWFEQARTEFFRVAGASYSQMEADGYMSPVLELNVQYKNPTHYGEFVDVETTLERVGSVRFKFNYKVFVEGKLCTIGYSIHCLLKDGKPTRDFPAAFTKFFPEG